nr:MAG TPA: hypothetical protein [Caudoviricetes sp.]
MLKMVVKTHFLHHFPLPFRFSNFTLCNLRKIVYLCRCNRR